MNNVLFKQWTWESSWNRITWQPADQDNKIRKQDQQEKAALKTR